VNTTFLLLFIALQIADIWTTLRALELGHREVNPILAKLFTRFEPLAVMVTLKLPAVWLLSYLDSYLLTMAACLVYMWVVISNWNVIKGGK
jgi:hypothetical protein